MEVFGGKPGHVDGCTGWCFLSSCIVVAQPIFSDAQVCPLHQVMDVLCKHHNVGRKVDGNPNPLVRGKKSKVGPSTRLRNRRHLGTTRENSRKVWIIGMDRHGFFLWMRFRFLGKWRPSGLRRWPENPIEQQVYIYIFGFSTWLHPLKRKSNCIPYLLFLGSCPSPRTYLSLFHFVSFMIFMTFRHMDRN
jgi:hypothetical protein